MFRNLSSVGAVGLLGLLAVSCDLLLHRNARDLWWAMAFPIHDPKSLSGQDCSRVVELSLEVPTWEGRPSPIVHEHVLIQGLPHP